MQSYYKGDQIHYYKGDVSDQVAFSSLVQQISTEVGNINGVIHTAAEKIDDQDTLAAIEHMSIEGIRKQFNPKVNGVLAIHQAFNQDDLDFVWLTSSNSTWIGGISYGAYAAANRFMDAFVEHHREELENWYCVNLEGIGKDWIDFHYLPEILEYTLSIHDIPQIAVSNRNLNALIVKSEQEETTTTFDTTEETETISSSSEQYVAPTTDIEEKVGSPMATIFLY